MPAAPVARPPASAPTADDQVHLIFPGNIEGRTLVDYVSKRLNLNIMFQDQALGGAASIPCRRSGFTPTYAVELQDPYHKRHWLLFAGLSGQMVQIEDESQVQELWAALGGRDDAR